MQWGRHIILIETGTMAKGRSRAKYSRSRGLGNEMGNEPFQLESFWLLDVPPEVTKLDDSEDDAQKKNNGEKEIGTDSSNGPGSRTMMNAQRK